MKKIKYSNQFGILFLILALVISSCTELEDTSYGEIIAEQFEPTEEDIVAIVGSAYGNWRQILLSGMVCGVHRK